MNKNNYPQVYLEECNYRVKQNILHNNSRNENKNKNGK